MTTTEIKVWDPLVRIFHWSLEVAFFIAYFTEDDLMWLHEPAGYIVLGLVAFRIVWGFVGPRYARFSDFVRGPMAVFQYLKTFFKRDAPRFIGHNPAGGMMVVILMVMLALTALTGIQADEAREGQQASNTIEVIQSAHADDEHAAGEQRQHEDEFWEEAHEVTANLTLILIILHISAVFAHMMIHGENLVRAMLTGKKDE